MAKKKQAREETKGDAPASANGGGLNLTKSDKIRQAFKDYPDKKPKAIADLLTSQGTPVTPGLVSQIKSNDSKKSGVRNGRRGRRKGSRGAGQGTGRALGQPVAASQARSGHEGGDGMLAVDDVVTVRGLARRLGKDALHQLVDAVAD